MLNIEEFAEKHELFDGHYVLIRPLSVDGATADVWLALDFNTVTENIAFSDIINLHDDEIEKLGLIVAIKIYRPQNALDIEGEQRFRDEYMIVFNCHHTNLIHPTHFSIFKETPYLVLPYCKLGSSELLIGKKLDNEDIWKYILDVSSGLAYLHSLTPPIIHQDIKPANILLDDTLHYAITDFGISSQKGGVHGFYYDGENSGTLAYMAPERFQEGAEPIPQSDIWAFGATLCEILTGKVPFGEEGGRCQVKTSAPMPSIPGVPTDVEKLIHACLAKEPGDRPSAEQIMKAASARQYPIKSAKMLYALFATALVIAIGAIVYTLQRPSVIAKPSTDEQYAIALNMVNQDNADSLKRGLALMDSLSNVNYVPAIYELAFTYGWYADTNSVRRKKLLGIEMNDSLMPTSRRINILATEYLSKIIDLKDSSHANVNADAAYRLACYYLNKNSVFVADYKTATKLLNQSRQWALMAGNNELINKIDKGLSTIEE